MADTNDLRNMIMSFRVAELYTLLGFAGRNKVGRKQDLQTRALELLKLKSAPIQMKIRELFNTSHGNTPPAAQTFHTSSTSAAAVCGDYSKLPTTMATTYQDYFGQNDSNIRPNNLPIHPDVRLKRLPFQECISVLIKPSTLMAVGIAKLQQQSFMFHLTPAQTNELSMHRKPNYKTDYTVQVLLRLCRLETTCEQEDFLPPGIYVNVNGSTCELPPTIPTQQGVEPKRLPYPVNITQHVRISSTVANVVQVHWSAEFGREFVATVELVKKLTVAQLEKQLRKRGVKHADYTTGLIKEKLCADADSEIATTSLRVSLMCPLSKVRMTVPCRPTTCSHLQCFDAFIYLQMNERKPTWTCPVCDKPGEYDKLVIDGYFQEVLLSSRLPSDANEIELHDDGSWSVSVLKKEKQTDGLSLSSAKNTNGSSSINDTVEIIDDDVVAVDVSSDSEDNVIVKPVNAANITTVDLTCSDDEDDCPPTATIAKNLLDASDFGTKPSTSFGKPYLSPSVIDLDSSPSLSPHASPPRLSPWFNCPKAPALPPFYEVDPDADFYPPLSPPA